MTREEFYDLRISRPDLFDPKWGVTTKEVGKHLQNVTAEEVIGNAYRFIMLHSQKPWHLAHVLNPELFAHDHKP